jgi:hypothetical protein
LQCVFVVEGEYVIAFTREVGEEIAGDAVSYGAAYLKALEDFAPADA